MDSPLTAGSVLDRRWPTPQTGSKNGPLLSCGLSLGQPLVGEHRINLASESIFVQQHTKPGFVRVCRLAAWVLDRCDREAEEC